MNNIIPKHVDNIKNTEIKKSKQHWFWLFATSNIEKNTFLCEISWQILSNEEYLVFLQEYHKENKHFFVEKISILNDKILAIPFRTKFSFINHSDIYFNTDVKFNKETNTIKVFTTKNIKKWDEIFDKYNLSKHIDVLWWFGKINILK